ncbi:dynamin-binding protein, partial [Biomphalaria pfeifferi]
SIGSFSPELVMDIKSKLEENQKDIKKYEETRKDILQKLQLPNAVPAGEQASQDDLDFVESTLSGLKEEEKHLKENLFLLVPHEARLEKARLLAAQHAAQQAEEEERRREEERKRAIELKERRREQRGKVIEEIIETEKDYLLSLQLCLETFMDGQKVPAGVDVEFLLGNMEEIADVSQKVLATLETSVSGKNFEEQIVGKCFTHFSEDMKNTYAPYCRNHDDVIQAMERYTESPEVSDYLNKKLEKMREHMNVFDIAGVLIKPVQRILKYPLLLNELHKNTDDGHDDKEEIEKAIREMTDVAKAINEYKRRKDLVYKYKKSSDQTFSDKISKLNLHSIKKKSSRIKGRLSTNFGIALSMRDENFELEEAKFRNLEKAVKIFLRSVMQFLENSAEAMRCQETVVDDITQFYSGKDSVEARKLQVVVTKLLDLYDQMKKNIDQTVVIPLNTLVGLFNGPSHVIEKRFDKLLDYNSQLGKAENDKELQAAKNDYEAMNAQLLDELPKFYNHAFNLLKHCISAFVLARRDFMDQSLKENCVLLELPSMQSKGSTIETFNIRHTTAFDQMSLLSFIPRGYNPRVDAIKADKAKLRGKLPIDNGTLHVPHNVITQSGSQTEEQKQHLIQKYLSDKLFTVIHTYNASDIMDISLTEGSLVGVVKELDPMGNKERWFVDDGVNKGFIPCNVLTPYKPSPCHSGSSASIEEDILSIQSYDSSENIVLCGNDGRVTYSPGASNIEATLKQQPQVDYQYYALYDFQARHPNEASLRAGHPVTVLAFKDVDGNAEWWLVETEDQQRGYAPANYMAAMPLS